jgi:hypothetical protein
MGRIFISYKRNVEPDHSLSQTIAEFLTAEGHSVFIDRTMRVGTDWARTIEAEVRKADYLILLLSEASSRSEMVKGEIEIARDQQKNGTDRPRLLPVRVAFAGKLPYPLHAWLEPIQYGMWRAKVDTPRVLAEIRAGLDGVPGSFSASDEHCLSSGPDYSAPLPLSRHVPPPGGTVPTDDPWYISRSVDTEAIGVIQQDGGRTINIRGARQMGKSSLLVRVVDRAMSAGRNAVVLDFQLLGSAALTAPAAEFFKWFSNSIGEQLECVDIAATGWQEGLSPAQNCSSFVQNILSREATPLTVAIDEADVLFAAEFRNDFFGMLRSWHNHRANPKKKSWKKLDIVLAASTEPYLFIDRGDQSPFNVGLDIEMTEFSREEISEANRRHGSPLFSGELDRLYELLQGHPFLTRKALYIVSGDQPKMTPAELFESAADESGPFGDHLRNHLLRVSGDPALIGEFRNIVLGRSITNQRIYDRLRAAGLVKRIGGKVVARSKLYEDYFRQHLYATAD